MFKRHYMKGQNPWVFLIGVILMLSIIFTMFNQKKQDTLDVYTDPDKVAKEEQKEEDTKLDIETQIYTDSENHFSIEIPDDWEEVTQDGYPTFVHSASASSIQIQTLKYDPLVNQVSSDTLSAEIAGSGRTFTSFNRNDSASYQLMYQDYKNSTYDYIEEVYWDRDAIIKLVCTFNDENYSRIIPYYEYIIDSFAWDRQSEIPKGCAMYYNENAGFEVAVPDNWGIGVSGNAVVATDPETGATQTLSILDTPVWLDTVTSTDMAGLLNTGQSGFIMNSYKNTKESAVVNCSFLSDDIQYQQQVYVFADGKRLYFVTFAFEAGMIEETLPQTCADTFRAFPSEDKDTESTDTETSSPSPEDEKGANSDSKDNEGVK